MELDELKNMRLVCRLWSVEALRGFKNQIIIQHNPKLLDKINPTNITTLLVQHEIQFGLTTSFLDIPWYLNTPRKPDKSRPRRLWPWPFDEQNINNKDYFEVLITSFFQSSSAAYLTELRIELNIFYENDSDLLVKALSKTFNLEILAIDFVLVKKKEVKTLPEKLLVPLNKLKILGLRNCHGVISEADALDLECWIKILGLFPGIKSLDQTSWQQLYGSFGTDTEAIELCRQALIILHLKNQYFESLEGWQFGLPWWSWNYDCVLPFSHHLKYISIHRGANEPELIFPLLAYHSPSLRRLELFFWRFSTHHPRNLDSVDLQSFNLPVLEYLGLCIQTEAKHSKEFGIENEDILDMRNIILGESNNFNKKFPNLHTINISVSYDVDKEFLNYVFPKEVKIEINGITSLGISLFADCKSEEITRFYAIFPDLQIFKHLRKDTRSAAVVCVHKKCSFDKKFYPLKNSYKQIVKPIFKEPPDYYALAVYYLLRGTFYEEPFFSKDKHLKNYFAPEMYDISISARIRRKNCLIT